MATQQEQLNDFGDALDQMSKEEIKKLAEAAGGSFIDLRDLPKEGTDA
jgi:hypothetical protein